MKTRWDTAFDWHASEFTLTLDLVLVSRALPRSPGVNYLVHVYPAPVLCPGFKWLGLSHFGERHPRVCLPRAISLWVLLCFHDLSHASYTRPRKVVLNLTWWIVRNIRSCNRNNRKHHIRLIIVPQISQNASYFCYQFNSSILLTCVKGFTQD